MVQITINNRAYEVEADKTILQVAKDVGVLIPHLCYLEGVHDCGSCRLCIVDVEGSRNFMAACMTKVTDGMVIRTNTEELRHARKLVYELILSDHNKDCLSCSRNQSCELQALGEQLNLTTQRFEGDRSKTVVESTNPSIERDMSKCILCRRCVTMCNEIQGVGILNAQNRGFNTVIGPSEGFELMDVNCTFCGQCTTVCPVGALKEKDAIEDVWQAIQNPNKRVVVQTAPAVRAALGEEFGYEPGTLVTGKMAAALRLLGFDDVFDTNFTADLTIIEEGNELLSRLGKALSGEGATLPMITSCSPGWIKYAEHTFPEQVGHLSTCKSPHMMLGALTKSYYAEKIDVAPEDFYVVSVMPCTAKKFEATRAEMIQDVDAVLTTRELAKMIKTAGIDFRNLADSDFDNPLGLSSGAADIFGTTGGVMEAAIRTVYEIVTGDELPFDNLHVEPIVGLEGIKTAELKIEKTVDAFKMLEGQTLKVAVASGLSNAHQLLKEIEAGTSPYHFIEIMCCPNGCISGGGQPRPATAEVRKARMEAIYKEDESKALRKSHNNPYVAKLYEEFLEKPLGHKSHELLHTHYVPRGKFNEYMNK